MMFPLSSFEKMSLQDVDNILGIRRSLYSFLCAFSAMHQREQRQRGETSVIAYLNS